MVATPPFEGFRARLLERVDETVTALAWDPCLTRALDGPVPLDLAPFPIATLLLRA